ncbi:unnamed protein product [Dicrocoelium dendriticum]|nr:unnamed protein product [Dicrocoelium dendriticum]
MKAVVFPSLLRAANRSISSNEILRVGERDPYTFAVLADPQPGLLERYVEKRPKPYRWDREISLTEHAIQLLNRVKPKPKFVVVCGDLVDANAFSEYREAQTLSLLNAFSKLDPSIRLVTVPGNHDVGDFPTKETVLDHVQTWGDDYYSFQVNRTKFLVLNSQYMWNDTKCKPFGDKFNEWLDDQLRSLELRRASLSIVFQHIPFFINEPNEPDDYFNLPIRTRLSMLSRLYDAGARSVGS